jgi:lipopolysaccharide/colanic/teichoic acid biosynthesis glycosyltransferase
VTPVGRILRRASLDELPQLWNILRGEMSMVGPRPIVNDEVTKYGQWFGLYCRVVPGLTGLWQVSGRSDTDYGKRIELDTYYVRNWSPWFDIYLLARTFRTVIKGEGAY